MFRPDAEEPATNYVTPLTDISANIFAMMVLILILALAGRQNAISGASRDIISEQELSIVERKAMTPAELVQHLYDRRDGPGPLRIDLLETGIAITATDGSGQKFEGADAVSAWRAQQQASGPQPVRLYVFSHRRYDEVIRSLLSANRQWLEISVPEALQAGDRAGWSQDFTNLLSQQVSLDEFRTALAQLLASKDPKSKATGEGQPKTSPLSASQGTDQPYETLLERIIKWLRWAVMIVALFAGFAFIWWVERTAQTASKRDQKAESG